MKKTESRKKDHVELVLQKNVQYSNSPGFDSIKFIHNSLPEMDFNSIDLSSDFLGRKLSCPIIITGMTGGYKGAENINRDLAKTAEKYGLAFGLGSQRAMIENKSLKRTYDVRRYAPSISLIANIGGVQLTKYPLATIRSLVEEVDADALAVHLNPLQEIVQSEGDKNFRGVLDAITSTTKDLGYPVIIKETGAGISTEVALKLKHAGVRYVDVSGSGGTSWSKVEYLRGSFTPGFEEWGITTVESIKMCKGILPLIASGGIRSGIDIAKAIALGADLGGAAYPFLKAQKEGKLRKVIETWISQLKTACLLTGSSNYRELKKAKLIDYGI